MKFIFIFICFVQWHLHAIGQNLPDSLTKYYKLSNEAEWLSYNKDYRQAILTYKRAFTYNKPQAKEVKNLVKSILSSKQYDTATAWIKYGIKNFGFHIYDFTDDSTLNEKYFHIDEAYYFSLFYFKEYRNRDCFFIEHYFFNDKFFRLDINSLNFDEYIKNIGQKRYLTLSLAVQCDTLFALPFVYGLIKKYNFPDARDVGNYYMSLLYFMLRHYPIPKEIYDKALLDGKIPPREYASLVDYRFNVDFMENGEIRMINNYGTTFKKDSANNTTMNYIDKIDQVDERRAKIGLQPIWMESKVNEWPYLLSDEYKRTLK